jgi:AraC-like DNA-binding protein
MKRRDGFEGEKLINLPPKVYKEFFNKEPGFFQIYVAHIGFFPKASGHYREWRKGCEDNIIFYCLNGKGYYVIGDKKYQLTANQYTIIPASDKVIRYWADAEDPWTIYWVHFNGENLQTFNSFLQIDQHKGPVQIPFNAKGIELWQDMCQSLELGYSKENLCNASFCLYSFVATFLFPEKHIAVAKEESTDITTLTIRFMRENLYKKLSIEDMATRHRMSSSHFSTLFRKSTGMPPIDYFINIKMQKACQLLYANESRIKDIALELGYDDPYYFSRVFKKYMGISPEQYKITTFKTSAKSVVA